MNKRRLMLGVIGTVLLILIGMNLTPIVYPELCSNAPMTTTSQGHSMSGGDKEGFLSKVLRNGKDTLVCKCPPAEPCAVAEQPKEAAQHNAVAPASSAVSCDAPDVYLVKRHKQATTPRKGANIVIGIPTVKRESEVYVTITLRSLLTKLSDDEKSRTLFVVFLADKDKDAVDYMFDEIYKEYETEIRSSMIEIVTARPEVYPVYAEPLRRTFNDPAPRVKWRSKQNFDFALLMAHCHDRADYYLQLEDDVIASENYVDAMITIIDMQNEIDTMWSMLEFSKLGFIAKLFKNSELLEIANLLRYFHLDQPCDFLMIYFIQLKTQGKRIHSKNSLFQHVGRQSSLPGKIQELKDHSFVEKGGAGDITGNEDDLKVDWGTHKNPPAAVTSNIMAYGTYSAQNLYNRKRAFWGAVNKDDEIRVDFETPQYVTEIFVQSGHPKSIADRLENGSVHVSYDGNTFTQEATLEDEVAIVTLDGSKAIKAFKIVVDKNQGVWAILSDLRVTVKN